MSAWDARVQNTRSRQLQGLEPGEPITGELVRLPQVDMATLQRWNIWLSMGASIVVIVAGVSTLLKTRG